MDLAPALEAALSAARAAGDLLRAELHRPGGPRGEGEKAEADVEAENLIRERLLAALPGSGFLGEETGRTPGEAGAPLWVVDPNDGTRDFLASRRGSSVSIALLRDRRPALGVVHAFAYPDDAGELFSWAEGSELRRGDRAVSPRLPDRLGPLDTVLVSSRADVDPDGHFACVAPARYRALPSVAHRLALVAAGEAAAASATAAPVSWDYAAGQALLRGAGGVLRDQDGAEVGYAEDGGSRCRFAVAGSAAVTAELAGRPWASVARQGPWPWDEAERTRPGELVADVGLLSRAQGCLLGQVAGDSLGSLVEFKPAREIALAYRDGPRRLEDGGTWTTLAGQPTDDSEMALALARTLAGLGTFDADAVLAAYRAWHGSAPFDVGNTTRAALVGYLIGSSQANGSLMRSSPLGVFAHAFPAAAAGELGTEDSRLTHPHAACRASVGAFVVAVAHAVAHGDGPEGAYRAAVDWARGASASAEVLGALEEARHRPPVCDGKNEGWVLFALRNAFFELLHAPSLEEGVVATVRRGGDTDTNAAIAGALLGAVHGREAVPEQWRLMVLSCRPHAARARRPRPAACWPVDVLELAERLVSAGRSAARR